MEGARALGMRHVWMVDAAAPATAPCCAGDPVIRDLAELQSVLS